MQIIRNYTIVDTETAAVTEDAIVFTIAAVKFTSDLQIGLSDIIDFDKIERLDMALKTTPQIMALRISDTSTTTWHSEQSDEVKADIARCETSEAVNPKQAIKELLKFIGDSTVYVRGTDFEGKIIPSLAKSFGIKWTKRYDTWRDIRTAISEITETNDSYQNLKTDTQKSLVKHTAIGDCYLDAIQLHGSRQLRLINDLFAFNMIDSDVRDYMLKNTDSVAVIAKCFKDGVLSKDDLLKAISSIKLLILASDTSNNEAVE